MIENVSNSTKYTSNCTALLTFFKHEISGYFTSFDGGDLELFLIRCARTCLGNLENSLCIPVTTFGKLPGRYTLTRYNDTYNVIGRGSTSYFVPAHTNITILVRPPYEYIPCVVNCVARIKDGSKRNSGRSWAGS